MSVDIGDVAPDFSGTDLTSNAPWSLYGQAPAHMLLAFTALTGASPFDYEAEALAAVWNTLNGKTAEPFAMAIIGGIKGPGGPAPQETAAELTAAIKKFQITCPVVLAPPEWFTYLFPTHPAPSRYCLHWEDGEYIVGDIKTGVGSVDVDALASEIVENLKGCGVHVGARPNPSFVNFGSLLAIPVLMQLFGGIASDGGGTGLTFGGRPIKVGPWDPLQPLGTPGRDAAAGLAIASLASQIQNREARTQIWRAGVSLARTSIDRLEAAGPGPISGSFTITKG